MSFTPDQLIRLASKYVKLAEDALDQANIDVPQPETFEDDFQNWKQMMNSKKAKRTYVVDDIPMELTEDEAAELGAQEIGLASDYMVTAADKKKLDPKAKVRNKPSPVVPAERAKDKKDHFPLGSESQARNALARVMQYTSAPPWWKGSLKGLQDAVRRKVKSKYPGIEQSSGKKKSSLMSDLVAFAHDVEKYAQMQLPDDTLSGRGQGADLESSDPNVKNKASQKWYIQKVQEYLMQQGYKLPRFGADGIITPNGETAAALKQWQQKSGLQPSGQLDYNTLQKLEQVPFISGKPATQKLPVDLGYARARIEAARAQLEYLNKAYQSGQLRDPRAANNALEQLQPFLDDQRSGIKMIVQQLNGMAQMPNLDEGQKKTVNDMLFNANDGLIALEQWKTILSGQFAQTGQMPGVNAPASNQQAPQQQQQGQAPPPPPPAR